MHLSRHRYSPFFLYCIPTSRFECWGENTLQFGFPCRAGESIIGWQWYCLTVFHLQILCCLGGKGGKEKRDKSRPCTALIPLLSGAQPLSYPQTATLAAELTEYGRRPE